MAPNDLNCRFWPKIDHFWAISETQLVIKNVKKCVHITRVSPQSLLKPLKLVSTSKTDVAQISLHCPIWHTVRGAPDLDRFATAPGVRLIIPPRIPAKQDGRRRATLLVCPTSLISHWVEQLNIHLLQGVQLRLKIHHGQSKAQSAGELEAHDLVITTYGILAAEFTNGEISRGPLLNTLWLRVVLDEGHQVKNHLGKAHKAALQLNVERKWVVSGTPIQNNLMEFWSVLNFLGSNTYGGRENMRLYRRQIEKLCQRGDERGYQRLKVTNSFFSWRPLLILLFLQRF